MFHKKFYSLLYKSFCFYLTKLTVLSQLSSDYFSIEIFSWPQTCIIINHSQRNINQQQGGAICPILTRLGLKISFLHKTQTSHTTKRLVDGALLGLATCPWSLTLHEVKVQNRFRIIDVFTSLESIVVVWSSSLVFLGFLFGVL